MEGRSQIRRHQNERASNRILLMTDGLANRGITDPDRLAGLFREARAQGVTTSTVGFGPHFDEQLLQTLADAGGGNTHYVEHPDQAPDVFRAELDELLALSAQNLTVELRPESGVELVAVHHSYPREAIHRGLQFRLGDLYASEPKQLLVTFRAYAAGNGDVGLAQLQLRADVLADTGGIEQRTLSVPIRFDPLSGPLVNPEVRRTLVFLEAAAARRDALEDERQGRFDHAARRLRAAAHEVLALADDDEGREEAGDLELMASHLDHGALTASDSKYLHARSYSVMRAKLSHKDILSRVKRGRSGPGRGNRKNDRSGSVEPPDSGAS
jgi:Ca-activated chloride channel family protein